MNMQKIKAALLYGDGVNQGRPALFAEGRNSEKWKEIQGESPFYKDEWQLILEAGRRYLEQPIRSLRFSDYKIYDLTGSRKEYEREYFEHRGRLKTFAVLSAACGEDPYIHALEDAIWAICDEYTWCLPAHLGGESLTVYEKTGPYAGGKKNIGRIREHQRQVDLFASETGFALMEICSMLEERLAPIVVHRVHELVKERILQPYCELNSMFWWETATNNWAAVCAGSVGAAALYLIKDNDALAPVLLRLLGTMETFLSGYAEDGACTEGLGYWKYGFGLYTYFAELLRQRTAGQIDLMQGEKIRQIALFQQKCYLSDNNVVSFSDANLTFKFQPGLTWYLKNCFGEVEIPDIQYRARFMDNNCHNWAEAIRNLIWSSPGMGGGGLAGGTYYLKDAQWLVSRLRTGMNAVSLAAKGGHNDEPHNHNDVGNFILDVNGELLLTDTGAGEYTKQYFGPERYTILCNSSRGHSVPVINGGYQAEGRGHSARVLEQSGTTGRDVFVLEISRAYNDNSLVSLLRSFVFEKTAAPKLTVKDSYTFEHAPSSVTERFVTFREPKLLSPGRVEIQGERGRIFVVYDPNVLEFSVEKDIFVGPRTTLSDLYLLDLKVKNPQCEFTAEIIFEVETV